MFSRFRKHTGISHASLRPAADAVRVPSPNAAHNFPVPDMEIKEGLLADPLLFDVEPIASVHSFNSEACRTDHFAAPNYRYWCERLHEWGGPRFHRKQWEWIYIVAALHERGQLQPGKRGLGFGVGREPLADFFASTGVTVVATDQQADGAIEGGWMQTGQHSLSLEQLYSKKISAAADFNERVTFRHADMNCIPPDLVDFDFCWSSCCYEHLGSIQHGLDFIHNSLRTLKPGGYSVHTTELNLSSDTHTFESPGLSLFRKQDFRRLAQELRALGHEVAPLVFYPGAHPVDAYVDLPPFRNDPHIRLEVAGYAVTSFGIVVRKAG